jgi:hypothetical protein
VSVFWIPARDFFGELPSSPLTKLLSGVIPDAGEIIGFRS